MTLRHSVRSRAGSDQGFSLIEMMMVVLIIGVLAVITVPMSGNAVRFIRLSGDARDLSNATAVTKMRAAAKFTKARLFVDIVGRTFHIETYEKPTPTFPDGRWVNESGVTQLSSTVFFGFGPVTDPPANTQTTINHATECMTAASPPVAVANTSCIIFNSRGLPIKPDASGSPDGDGALYVTDSTAVYGITVGATGFVRLWRTNYTSSPTWSLQ
jgi:prepilin-type N-terminal cleavage/methylation domain-containing protein